MNKILNFLKRWNYIILLIFILVFVVTTISLFPTKIDSLLIPLIASLFGSAIGVIGGYAYNRQVRLEDQWLQLNLRKYEALNKLYNAFVGLHLVVKNIPNFTQLWTQRNMQVKASVEEAMKKIDVPYFQIDFLMSEEMGLLNEYIGKSIIHPFFWDELGKMRAITEKEYETFLKDLFEHLGLMMGLIKIECNADALIHLLYRRLDNYAQSIDNWETRKDIFIKKNYKAMFDKMRDVIAQSDLNDGLVPPTKPQPKG